MGVKSVQMNQSINIVVLFYLKMSSTRFPPIKATDSKKHIQSNQEQYNFVNKETKNKNNADGPLQIIEELKRKVEDQKSQIDKKNSIIQGLQRNFQSLSLIVKNEKAHSAAIQAQLESLKKNLDSNHQKAIDYQEKCLVLQGHNKILKQELTSANQAHKNCYQYQSTIQNMGKALKRLQLLSKQQKTQIDTLSSERAQMQQQLLRNKNIQKYAQRLRGQLIELEKQMKNILDKNQKLNINIKVYQNDLQQLKGKHTDLQQKANHSAQKLKQTDRKKALAQQEAEEAKRKIRLLETQLNKLQNTMESKDAYAKVKDEDGQRAKNQIKQLRQQNKNLQKLFQNTKEKCTYKTEQIEKLNKLLTKISQQYQQKIQQFQKDKNQCKKQSKELVESLKQLDLRINSITFQNLKLYNSAQTQHCLIMKQITMHLRGLSHRLEAYDNAYGKYISLIQKSMPNVIILNEKQMQKIKNNSSQAIQQYKVEITALTEDNYKKQRSITQLKQHISCIERQLKQKTSELERQINDKKKMEKMLQQESLRANKIQKIRQEQKKMALKSVEENKLNSQKQIEEERLRLIKQQQRMKEQLECVKKQKQQVQNSLIKYQIEQEKLKKMMEKEHQEMERIAKEKKQQIQKILSDKEIELEHHRQNNKLLWSDNKKLKEMETKIRQQAEKEMDNRQHKKKQELQNLKKQLQNKYRKQINNREDGNAAQLKKLLLQKATQMKKVNQSYNSAKSEIQFLKNRQKELEGVAERKENTSKKQIQSLQRAVKQGKEIIKKMQEKQCLLQKQYNELDSNYKTSVTKYKQEVVQLKQYYESMKVDEKLKIINKSLNDLEIALKAMINTFSCNYCIEVVSNCVRLQCGHIYCQKCQAGYDPNCGECKRKSYPLQDKLSNQAIAKAHYMKMVIANIHDQIASINLR